MKGKIKGGCATVAGWGNRYDHYGHNVKDSSCKTNFANKSPHKIA